MTGTLNLLVFQGIQSWKMEIDGPRMDVEDPSVESSYRRTSLRRVANR